MTSPITIDQCVAVVASATGVSVDDILSPVRTSTIARARSVAIYLAREHSDFLGRQIPWPVIGTAFHRDHTTAIHAHKSVRAELRHNARLRAFVQSCATTLVQGVST